MASIAIDSVRQTGGGTCRPFVFEVDELAEELFGFCYVDLGAVDAGARCTTEGYLGGDCADFAACLAREEDGTAECMPLCEPFSGEDECGDGSCSGVPPLVGEQSYSYCWPDPQPGEIGDRCSEQGVPCAAADSVCLDMGVGAECLAVCRAGRGDCAAYGTDCATDRLSPSVVPSFMGVCL